VVNVVGINPFQSVFYIYISYYFIFVAVRIMPNVTIETQKFP